MWSTDPESVLETNDSMKCSPTSQERPLLGAPSIYNR